MGVRRTLLTAGLVMVLVVGGLWVHVGARVTQAQQVKKGYATIAFYMNRNKCVKKIVTDGGGDKVHGKRKGEVQWTVTNGCDASIDVRLDDFASPAELFSKPPNACGPMAPGSTCTITAVIHELAKIGTHKYSVYDGRSKKDPDLIIDQ
jgi:hypothetical protein